MTLTVPVAKAKARFSALVARADAGEEVILTRNGRLVARIAPLKRRAPTKYGDLEGLYVADDLSLPEDVMWAFNNPERP